MGVPPNLDISENISKKRLHEKSPETNVYQVPYFFQDYILSNDMCFILVRLLSENPKNRYQSLAQLRKDLMTLRDNIYATPPLLRRILGHPILPADKSLTLRQTPLPAVIDFKSHKPSSFSLKYLGKFLYEHNLPSLSINGGPLPLLSLKQNQLIDLNLRD